MISVTNLSKTYKRGKVKALNDVNFTVSEGEVLGSSVPTAPENHTYGMYARVDLSKLRRSSNQRA